jgi:FkbH-like protein
VETKESGTDLSVGAALVTGAMSGEQTAPAWSELLDEAANCEDAVRFQALARKAMRLEVEIGPPAGHIPARIALLGAASTDLLERPLRLALRLVGLAPELYVTPYDVWRQEMLEDDSATARFLPQVVIALLTPHIIPTWPQAKVKPERATELARAVCRQIYDACARLHDRCNAEIVLNTLPPFPQQPLGNLSAKSPEAANNFIRRINVMLGDMAPSYVHLNDVAALVERRGLNQWFDVRLWHEAKQPVAPGSIPELVRNIAAVVGAIFGRNRKCLVVDLDNTLWGGVVGEVGVQGLVLGEGSGSGEAFKAFQMHLKTMKDRGVLLAVCSKNDERNAVRPFEEHPEMVLKREDFVAFKANWHAKSDNLRAIASELNIGLDALVFADDNPAEREEVRQALPQVFVLELTADPADYPMIVDATRCFEVSIITEEDRRRSGMYRQQSQRSELLGTTRNLGEFLTSLEMRATICPFEPVSFARITQLVNKTNQFNLTTRRLTGAEVAALAISPAHFTRTVRLNDRFGDHGLVTVLFGRIEADTLTLDGWLMSCRVLNRGIEQLLLNEVVAAASRLGVTQIVGRYIPTDRNALVKDLYKELGFSAVSNHDGMTTWRLEVEGFKPLPTCIGIRQHGGTA